MRCDGRPVRPGTGTTQGMSKASQPDEQNGTLFADSIRASSLNRLHQQAGQKTAPDQCHCVNLSLATREPSTEDIGGLNIFHLTGPNSLPGGPCAVPPPPIRLNIQSGACVEPRP